MTRKDYVQVAAAFADSAPCPSNYAMGVDGDAYKIARNAWGNAVFWMADSFEQTNPRFDRARFNAACGFMA